jgi:hypothetical protein
LQLGLEARGALTADTQVWATGMDDWETWGEMRESFMDGVCEPLYNVGEWVYVWYERKWHYATITQYIPSDEAQDKGSGPWSVDYVFADFSHGEFVSAHAIFRCLLRLGLA